MRQCVLEGFSVGPSERTGYLHVGKLVSTSAQERCLLEFVCFGVLNIYIFYIKDIQNTSLRTCANGGAL